MKWLSFRSKNVNNIINPITINGWRRMISRHSNGGHIGYAGEPSDHRTQFRLYLIECSPLSVNLRKSLLKFSKDHFGHLLLSVDKHVQITVRIEALRAAAVTATLSEAKLQEPR